MGTTHWLKAFHVRWSANCQYQLTLLGFTAYWIDSRSMIHLMKVTTRDTVEIMLLGTVLKRRWHNDGWLNGGSYNPLFKRYMQIINIMATNQYILIMHSNIFSRWKSNLLPVMSKLIRNTLVIRATWKFTIHTLW